MAASLDQVFSTAILNLLIPDTSLPFPPETPVDVWLERAQKTAIERKQAFFDEQLHSFLVLRIENPSDEDPENPNEPPEVLLDLLGHVQVSLEASYISSAPAVAEIPRTSRLLGTPRTGLPGRTGGRLHPSILPPSTPNPMPATADQDRKYTMSEGTILVANIWGSNTSENSPESLALLWSEGDKNWVAIYRMSLTVSFLRLAFNNPLLCLTVSATLREKPIPTQPNHPLTRFFASVGYASPETPKDVSANVPGTEEEAKLLDGLEEVNLLGGLLAGTTFHKIGPSEMNLPSLRLGTVSRQKLFSLPPVLVDTPVQPSPSPMTAVRKAHPTLRKSYRKTLQTVSGFRVRMRTVFVPYVLLPETEGAHDDLDEEQKERERREAGSEERTVVLCVEIENSGDLGMSAGFMVEKVDVTIGGEGAKATLIAWGDHRFSPEAAQNTFPLMIGSLAQYNLLYAVTFMRSPEEIDGFSFARNANDGISPELQRAVTINIFGKPYFPSSSMTDSLSPDTQALSYPTRTFSSRWNCVLDLTAQQVQPSALDPSDPTAGYPNILPEPPSPFPVFALHSANTNTGTPGMPGMNAGSSTPQYSATAGSKRFTLAPGVNFAGRTLKNLTPSRASTRLPDPSPMISSRPTSQVLMSNPASAAQYLRSPTTYSAPPLPPLPLTGHIPPPAPIPLVLEMDEGNLDMPYAADIPITPAYPSFPSKSALPPTPTSQAPVASSSHGNVGLSVEIRRERGVADALPFVSGAFGEQKMLAKLQASSVSGENIVVSVGLMPLPYEKKSNRGRSIHWMSSRWIFFVFNQSTWPRRFEVTCPDRRRRRRGGADVGVYDGGSDVAKKMGYPGVLPLESRIRIGPLRPSACQSVRMNFVAVSPGVHSIDTLTLTDVESGFSTNLRSVLDVVVHDPND
ncbi:TRAPP trafficking subunit Trs65-domain-containing protein [Gymnopilus junonius]|uniref:TRAPP trafficking subunit Trs65-domain-containing protein n=1 Tax=Gymnopilus junonius TaxID=109634 RepID=A0A9P5NV55_GYMJU|nr:TRAPP trafficking subunit Trs65-domain-containing protein [Gymnopilus junonius]